MIVLIKCLQKENKMSDNWLDEYKEGLFSGRIPMRNPKIKKPGDPEYYYYDPRGVDKSTPLKDRKLIGVPTADTPNPALAEMEKINQSNNGQIGWDSPYESREEIEKNVRLLEDQLIDAEGLKPFAYRDTEGNRTDCVGHMSPDEKTHIAQPWRNARTKLPATDAERRKMDASLMALPYGKKIGADFYKDKTDLELPEEYCRDLLRQDIVQRHEELSRNFPAYRRLNSAAQMGILETHFNANILRKKDDGTVKWPALRAELKKEKPDLATVCKELHRDETGRQDLIDRNKWAYDQCMKGFFYK